MWTWRAFLFCLRHDRQALARVKGCPQPCAGIFCRRPPAPHIGNAGAQKTGQRCRDYDCRTWRLPCLYCGRRYRRFPHGEQGLNSRSTAKWLRPMPGWDHLGNRPMSRAENPASCFTPEGRGIALTGTAAACMVEIEGAAAFWLRLCRRESSDGMVVTTNKPRGKCPQDWDGSCWLQISPPREVAHESPAICGIWPEMEGVYSNRFSKLGRRAHSAAGTTSHVAMRSIF